MKTNSLFLILLALYSLNFTAQTSYLNTGIDSSATGKLAPGNTDLHWSASLTGIGGPYLPAITVPTAFMWNNIPGGKASWISYPHACPGTTNQSISYCAGQNHDEFYKVSFDISNVGKHELRWCAYADNCIYSIYLNNTVTPVYMAPQLPDPADYYNSYGFSNLVSGTITTGWKLGTNTLYIHVKSGINESFDMGSYTGLTFTAQGSFFVLTNLAEQNPGYFESIYPNPAHDQITLRFLPGFTQKFSELLVLDVTGKIILSKTIDDFYSQHVVCTESLADGIYTIILTREGQFLQAEKFVVVHR